MRSVFAALFLVAAAVASAHAAAPGQLSIQVLSATTKDKVVPDAAIIFQKEGKASISGATDAHGKASVANAFGVDDASVSLIVKKDGFSPLVVQCPCNGLTYALSETLGQQSLEAFRVVLSWGATPSDLDLHTVYEDSHFYFAQKQGVDAFLDVDDIDSYGPETATIQKRHPGKNYVFAIHNYSAHGVHDTRALSDSGAKVFVYVGQSLIKSYYVPTNKVGALWTVFVVDGEGAIHDINSIADIAADNDVPKYLRQITRRTDFGIPMRVPAAKIAGAAALVQQGDAALQAGDGEGALVIYQKAIALNPSSTEAYAGIAKANAKLGRNIEATWAERKGSELAKLVPANGYRIPAEGITLAASSNLAPWKHYTFEPANLLDDNLWSSWQPNRKAAGGVGEWFKLTFATPQTLTGFEVSNGFRLIDELGDLYATNNRIKEAELQFSDGSTMPLQFDDVSGEKTFSLPAPKSGVSWVKVVVKSIYKGSKWNDLAVSEFHALGSGE